MMAKLFRGLLDILRARHDALVKEVIGHVRGFDGPNENDNPYQSVLGFWRMLAEMVFHVYSQLSLFIGILIVSALILIAWPLKFLVELFAGTWFLKNYHYLPHPADTDHGVAPTLNEENSKVVRRVVYEEAKVPKTK